MHGWGLIYDLLLSLAAALVLGLIFERLKLNAIIGYLLAGAIVGQGGLGLVQKPDEVSVIAEIGVALLLFTIGLEFSWRSLRKMGLKVYVGGGVMVLASTLFLTCVGIVAGLSWQAAVIIGAAGSLSSTAIVMRVLREKNDLDSVHGKATLGVLLVQDIAVVPLVLGVNFVANGSGEIGPAMGQALWSTAVLVLILVVFVGQIVPRLLHEKVVAQNREIPIILAVLTCVGATWAAHELGISPALGAFFAGMMLGDSKFNEQIRADVMPLRTLFVTIFFVSVGLLADLGWMVRHLPLVLATTLLVMTVKTLATYFAMRPFVRGIIKTLAGGFGLGPVGGLWVVVVYWGAGAGLFCPDVFQLVISTILLSLLVSPFLVSKSLAWAEFLAKRLVPTRKLVASVKAARSKTIRGHLVTIGYGEAGQATCSALRDINLPRLVIDLDPALVRLAEKNGNRAVIGDATSAEFLHDVAHIADARAILVTVSDHTICRRVVAVCKSIAPEVKVITRSRYHVFSEELDMVGADEVVDEEVLVGEQMGRQIARMLENPRKKKDFGWDSDVPYA